MPIDPIVRSVFVGLPATLGHSDSVDWYDDPWTSAIVKRPVDGPVAVTRDGLAGDGHADLVHHGGADKAVCAYPAVHYPAWRAQLERQDVGDGAFGENITVDGLAEDGVCIGDTWAVGDVLLEVSQPRQPCWKLARRWHLMTLTRLAVESGWTGWYFRVRHPGTLAAGAALALVARPHPAWTIRAANDVMHAGRGGLTDRRTLAALPELSASWRDTLARDPDR